MENRQEELTAEQLESRRDEMKEFYEKSLPYLKSQSEYEKLLTEIEEARFKRATMQMQYASMMVANQEDPEENFNSEPEEEKAPRTSGKKLRKN